MVALDEEILEMESPSEEIVSVPEMPQTWEVQLENTLSISDPIPVEIVGQDGEIWTYDEEYGVQVLALSPIESSSGLKGLLLDIIGPYDGIVVQYRYQQNTSSTNYSYVNDVQLDYPWLSSAALFIALLWSIFAIGGRIICRK